MIVSPCPSARPVVAMSVPYQHRASPFPRIIIALCYSKKSPDGATDKQTQDQLDRDCLQLPRRHTGSCFTY